MKCSSWVIVTIIGLSFLLASCAPTATPATPSQSPLTPPPTPSKATPAAAPVDAAWSKVVEAAKQEGRVTIYSFTFTGDVGLAVAKAFQDRYAIKVDIITGRGSEFIERVKTEQRMKQVTGDIMEGATTHALNMKKAGGTTSTLGIPVLREKDVWQVEPLLSDSEGHLLTHKSMFLSPWINTNLVKPGQEPKTYRELAKPEWKGKILVGDPALTTAPYNVFLALVDRGYLDMDFVRSLKGQDMRFFPGNVEVIRALAKGEGPFALAITDVEADAFVREGAPVKPIALEEGTVFNLSAIARIKDCPHPNAAQLFLNWILSQEGQTVFSKAAGMNPVRKDVPDFRNLVLAAVIPKRFIPLTERDAQRQADAFRDKLLVELWKK